MADSTDPGRSRLKLLLIFLLFFVPTVAAIGLIWADWRPSGTANHGRLVQPVEPIADASIVNADGEPVGATAFNGRWTVLVSSAGACEASCLQALDLVGHAHVALNKDMDRLQVGLVLPPRIEAPALPLRVMLLHARPAQLAEWASAATGGTAGLAVHLVDYRGFRMMDYPVPLDAGGMLKDIRRLLRLSDEELERRQRAGAAGQ